MDTIELPPPSPRSVRRHHRDRLKHNRRFHWHRDLALEQKALAKIIDTPTPCSCWCCGNPRKHFEQVTIQERRFFGVAINADMA